jgi:hypothetical protein
MCNEKKMQRIKEIFELLVMKGIQKSKFSVENSLTLIAEREIQPYKENQIKYNQYHLFNLPFGQRKHYKV